MSLNTWSTRWLRTSFILLLILIGCSLMLFHELSTNRPSSGSNPSIQKVRLMINPLLLDLEQNNQHLQDPGIREHLLNIAKENRIELSYIGLDGVVLLSSSPATEGKEVNLRSVLPYDLNHTVKNTNGEDSLNFAFPVMDGPEGKQIGNAVFTVPTSMIIVQETLTSLYIILGVLLVSSLILAMFLLFMKRKIRKRMLSPIHQLKEHTESILKGQYDKQIQYNRTDEMGELYAMLDLMRSEIMHLSEQRIRQEKAEKELITNLSHATLKLQLRP
ncbi:HAMP domain-containing protein [Paenibacillus sp. JNUCC31]|uniref:HAMP domain-containing protein n=1 Tax=Paenibacillus sp. JNUCC-31 TaxID=2777983 RepID=UPI00177C579E|nr:HAMP domain-containing protein [Paenibacillus sp. JNUCC-31]QOS81226.1 HAMP domain-containing protein [Paenibacillus sp. JNUCC-31]